MLPMYPTESRDSAMVDLTLRLPREIADRLAAYADDWNIPMQALVLSALRTEFDREDPEE